MRFDIFYPECVLSHSLDTANILINPQAHDFNGACPWLGKYLHKILLDSSLW